MLVETWNQVAGWGIEAIKNIQTQVGLAEEDGSNDEFVPAPLQTVAGHSIKTQHKEAATASSFRVDKAGISAPLAALNAEREVLAKAQKSFRTQIEKLGNDLAVERAAQFVNDSAIAGIQAHLADLHRTEHVHEHRLALLEDKISHSGGCVLSHTTEGYIHTLGGTEGYAHIDSPYQTEGAKESYSHIGTEYIHTVEGTDIHIEASYFHNTPVAGRHHSTSMHTSPTASHRGSTSPVRGSDSPVRGSASPVRGTTSPVHGSASPLRSSASSSPVRR